MVIDLAWQPARAGETVMAHRSDLHVALSD